LKLVCKLLSQESGASKNIPLIEALNKTPSKRFNDDVNSKICTFLAEFIS
jgi:hypothetical protein